MPDKRLELNLVIEVPCQAVRGELVKSKDAWSEDAMGEVVIGGSVRNEFVRGEGGT